MREFDTYTGTIKYRGIEFVFIFDKKELKLIPPKEKRHEVYLWFKREIATGVYTIGDPVYIENVIIGIANETGQKIIFMPSYTSVGQINSTLVIDIEYYIIYEYDMKMIDRIAIKGPEINHIFSTTYALNPFDFGDDGEISISTKKSSERTTKKEKFSIEGKELFVYFGISISGSYKTGESPINLSSTMFIEFSPTSDYEFIVKIVKISKQFIQYLCYRKNVVFSSVEMDSPSSRGLHTRCATLYKVRDNSVVDAYSLKKDKVIKYIYIQGAIGRIMDDIVSEKLYLEHIPETYELGRNINAGRFVMITAAFEWEFNRNFPDGIVKDQKAKEAEKRVSGLISSLISDNTGKSKEILKFLKKLIGSDSLENRIIEYGKVYGNLSDVFGDNLYALNDEKLDYRQMGKRLADQRNHFAHGDIDKEFIGLSLLDLIYLEYIIYIMQLKFYGLDDDNITSAIKDLF